MLTIDLKLQHISDKTPGFWSQNDNTYMGGNALTGQLDGPSIHRGIPSHVLTFTKHL